MSAYVSFDGMTWPRPGERLDDTEHSLRYGKGISMEDRLIAASVIAAYTVLVRDSRTRREKIVSKIRHAAIIAAAEVRKEKP